MSPGCSNFRFFVPRCEHLTSPGMEAPAQAQSCPEPNRGADSRATCSRSWTPTLGPNPLSVKLPVGIPEPAEGGLVVAGQAVVQVKQCVVTLHVLVQGVLQVPSSEKTCSGLPCTQVGPLKPEPGAPGICLYQTPSPRPLAPHCPSGCISSCHAVVEGLGLGWAEQ